MSLYFALPSWVRAATELPLWSLSHFIRCVHRLAAAGEGLQQAMPGAGRPVSGEGVLIEPVLAPIEVIAQFG